MPEILAPVGNWEMLEAAVINGADAVYLGLCKFSARYKAVGFYGEELKNAVEYAHLFGTKVYAAVNTLIKDIEVTEALAAVEEALHCNVDAFIVQDLGFACLIRTKFPTAILHASTQMGIHNVEGAMVAKKLGFSRIILARETLIEDIKKIKDKVDIQIECFVQGALCISFSGNCYFSSLASGYSGNRGKCMQLCRKKYSLVDNGKNINGYLLSAKDLNLSQKINELIKIGVDCFKIEGRLRRPEYVAESVRVYKKALKGCLDNNDLNALKKVFNRGDYTEGHLFTPTNRILDIKLASHKGLKIGKVISVKGKNAYLSACLNKGDGIKFLRNGTEVGNASISSAGNHISFVGSVKSGDDVYITTDSEFNNSVLQRSKKLNVDVTLDFVNKILTLNCKNLKKVFPIINAQSAVNRPISSEDVKECFNRSEYFTVNKSFVIGSAFMQKSTFNSMRRNAYNELKYAILKEYDKNMQKFSDNYLSLSDIISKKSYELSNFKTIYQVETMEQITDDMEIIAVNPREYSLEKLKEFEPYYDRAILNLPCISRGKDMDIIKEIVYKCNFKGYIVNNLYGIEVARNMPIILGYGLNIINDLISLPKIYSFESDKVSENGYVYAEGNLPLMNFCHCEKKELLNGCENCHGYDINLLYEGRQFYLRRYKIHYCYAQLLNCADLEVPKKDIRKRFIDYSFKRTKQITKGNYIRGLK